MTIVESFPISIVPERDKPAWCPPWCRAHSAQYAADFGTFKTPEEAAEALRDWRSHHRHIAHVSFWALTHQVAESYPQHWVERSDAAEGYDLAIEAAADGRWNALTPVHLSLHEPAAHMTSAEARQLAAYLIRAAHLVDRAEEDTQW